MLHRLCFLLYPNVQISQYAIAVCPQILQVRGKLFGENGFAKYGYKLVSETCM